MWILQRVCTGGNGPFVNFAFFFSAALCTRSALHSQRASKSCFDQLRIFASTMLSFACVSIGGDALAPNLSPFLYTDLLQKGEFGQEVLQVYYGSFRLTHLDQNTSASEPALPSCNESFWLY